MLHENPKMDGENKGKPYEQIDDLVVPLFLETPIRKNGMPVIETSVISECSSCFFVLFGCIECVCSLCVYVFVCVCVRMCRWMCPCVHACII